MSEQHDAWQRLRWCGRLFLHAPALWPLPSWLLVALLALCAPDHAWQASTTTRKTLSVAELALLASGMGTLLYWLTLWLSRRGLLHFPNSLAMRDASEQEIAIADGATRIFCLLLAYAGPLLLFLKS